MATSNQLMSKDALAAEVAAGRMSWKAGAQSGTQVVPFSTFQAQVNNDNTNPSGLAATQCPRYDELLARAQAGSPTSVALSFAGSCASCDYTMSGSWGGRPTGWNAFVSTDGGATFTNKGQVNSFTFAGGGKNTVCQFKVYFSNGTTTGPTVTSNAVTTPNCTGCAS